MAPKKQSPELGHSSGFLAARRLAEWVASVLAEVKKEKLGDDVPSLPALGMQIDAGVIPGHSVTLSFQPQIRVNQVSPALVVSNGKEPRQAVQSRGGRLANLLNEWATERVLLIQIGATDHYVDSPISWRKGTRSAFTAARSIPDGAPLPFLARRVELYVDSPVKINELTIQMFVLFSQWGWAKNASEEDRRHIIQYICGLFEQSDNMRAAAEKTLSFLFTNFVMPEHSGGFRHYIRRVAFDFYRKEGRSSAPAKNLRHKDRQNLAQSTEESDVGDVNVARRRNRNRSRGGLKKEFLTPHELASDCEIHFQRVYEAIHSGKLKATKWKGTMRIARSEGDRFKVSIKCGQAARAMVRNLRDCKKNKQAEALRKRIYRMKKFGASDEDILEALRAIHQGKRPPRRSSDKGVEKKDTHHLQSTS